MVYLKGVLTHAGKAAADFVGILNLTESHSLLELILYLEDRNICRDYIIWIWRY